MDTNSLHSHNNADKQASAVSYHECVTLPNDLEEVPNLALFVDGACQAAQLNELDSMQINLAMEEAVVNVMSYAYPDQTNGKVNIEATVDEKALTFVIRDHGIPFDPTTSGETDTSLSAEEREIGGLGIFLIRQYMDNIAYERVDGQNILTLTKYR